MSEVLASFLALRGNEPASAKHLEPNWQYSTLSCHSWETEFWQEPTNSTKWSCMVQWNRCFWNASMIDVTEQTSATLPSAKELYVVSFGVGTKFLKEAAASWTLQNHSQYDLNMDKTGLISDSKGLATVWCRSWNISSPRRRLKVSCIHNNQESESNIHSYSISWRAFAVDITVRQSQKMRCVISMLKSWHGGACCVSSTRMLFNWTCFKTLKFSRWKVKIPKGK